MTNVLITFDSRSGTTKALALTVAEGARVADTEVSLRRARELVGPDIMALAPGWSDAAAVMNARYEAPKEADAIVLDTLTRFGAIASELKAWLDGLGSLWARSALNGRAGGAFGSTSTLHGGNESTLLSMWNPLAHLGLIVVPTGYAHRSFFVAGTPYGASAVSGRDHALPTEDDLTVARFQGARTATVAGALRDLQISAI
ncbi:MAG: NAD(P)H:quinone oxidoreductase [Hyphomicrobium sp.]